MISKTFKHCARSLLLVTASMVIVACIIPIPAEVETDDGGGRNSPPVIIASIPEMPGPITLPQALSVTIKDIDLGDTLYIRVFRDYAEDPRIVSNYTVINDPETGADTRTRELDGPAICTGAVANEEIVVDVVVADRPFDENSSAPPANRKVTGNGEVSVRSWVARCVP
jgi:hypothetical protein